MQGGEFDKENKLARARWMRIKTSPGQDSRDDVDLYKERDPEFGNDMDHQKTPPSTIRRTTGPEQRRGRFKIKDDLSTLAYKILSRLDFRVQQISISPQS